ncbi:hypothetical protein AAFF_G00363800 [Aldrovandia affinis]|uniref:Uncharacterized protein n=1 Tax=Aldrovandia affinis TaxID=143900 RepID=A0AAD7SI36_9TELE|nr:hypothetical protein AAFF_G00363800 [Aldrovandia affinis]
MRVFPCTPLQRINSGTMQTSISEAVVFFFGILVSLQTVEGCSAPLSLSDYECPEYRLLHSYDNFEERFYNASHWLMVKIENTDRWTIVAGINKLTDYVNGENEERRVIPKTKPVAVTVLKSDSGEESNVSISFYVPPNTNLPKPTDTSITEISLPAVIMFVRSFDLVGLPAASDLFNNLDLLEIDLKSAGKQYNALRQGKQREDDHIQGDDHGSSKSSKKILKAICLKQAYRVPFERKSARVMETQFQFVQWIMKFDGSPTTHEYIYSVMTLKSLGKAAGPLSVLLPAATAYPAAPTVYLAPVFACASVRKKTGLQKRSGAGRAAICMARALPG